MPRQRSKKLVSNRKEETIPQRDLERHTEQDDSENEIPEISDKDEDEDELEKLVLGDGAGFKEQLGMEMDLDQEYDSEGNVIAEEDPEAEGGLENIDDADVRIPFAQSYQF